MEKIIQLYEKLGAYLQDLDKTEVATPDLLDLHEIINRILDLKFIKTNGFLPIEASLLNKTKYRQPNFTKIPLTTNQLPFKERIELIRCLAADAKYLDDLIETISESLEGITIPVE